MSQKKSNDNKLETYFATTKKFISAAIFLFFHVFSGMIKYDYANWLEKEKCVCSGVILL